MSRNEYLQNNIEEGFIKDTIKKGWNKIKSLFKIGLKKIKDFIVTFNSDGNPLPVVSFQATIDRIADMTGVEVFAPSLISDIAVEAGGNGCEEKASVISSDEVYDEGPTGEEYLDWLDSKKYKETPEYQNLLSMTSILAEHYGISEKDAEKIFEDKEKVDESWDGITKSRVTYVDKKELAGVAEIDYDEFEDILNDLVEERIKYGGKNIITSDGVEIELSRNILVFGAPGIGKSTIPNAVIQKYNENVAKNDPSKMISIISINCAQLEEGGLMMPTMPKEVDVVNSLKQFSDTFPQAAEFIEGLDDEQNEKIAQTMSGLNYKVEDAPKSWLPSYLPIGDDAIDKLQDAYANGGVYKDKNGCSIKTGCGGIIILDEFLRANQGVFSQLMNFFLERKLGKWELGSKWVIIACSNRPQDDGEVAEKWGDWNDSVATKDRMAKIYQLIPDPKQWLTWIRSKKIADELFLDFIFEKDSMVGDEYPRWHSMVRNGAGDSKQVEPITPRRWVEVFRDFKKYENKKGYSDLSEMSDQEISKVLKGSFDTDFISEITTWLRDHMDKIDLDGIMKDPKSVYLPQKFVNDPAKAVILIQNLFKEFEGRYKDNPKDCSDDELANIFIWLGINYKEDMVAVQNFMEDIIKSIYKDNSDNRFNKYIKAQQALFAAYPLKGIEADIEDAEHDDDEECRWPEDSLEIIKNLMREYFPWRIDGDDIKYFDDLSVE